MSKKPIILPKLPSALIRIAVADLKKVLAQPEKYRVSMGFWHVPGYADVPNDKCSVCFAGGVMAGTLKVKPTVDMDPGKSAMRSNEGQLMALNSFRLGNLRDAFNELRIAYPNVYEPADGYRTKFGERWRRDAIPRAVEVDYFFDDDPQLFLRAMARLADKLERRGL